MTARSLYLVREEAVSVEHVRPGDSLVLPSNRRVTVERVAEYDDGFVVRWWRRAERGEPGHPGGKNHAAAIGDAWNGRYLGSLTLRRRGDTVRVARG